MASLVVTKENGQILFDTSKICYGLIKSGYMQFIQGWTRKTLRSAQLDPTRGENWTKTVVTANTDWGDGLWGFSVTGARSPIVFLHGSGCLNGTIRNGDTLTFLYSNATTSTRFYCFDLMADNIPGSPYLKTYQEDGVITFNSLQPPLNVVHAITAPPPSGVSNGYRGLAYAGGRIVVRQSGVGPLQPQRDCIYDVALQAGGLYAAFLPWSRAAALVDNREVAAYAVIEGAYGRVGGMSFMFGASAGTTRSRPTVGPGFGSGYLNIPTDRYPAALVVEVSNLPFPYQ